MVSKRLTSLLSRSPTIKKREKRALEMQRRTFCLNNMPECQTPERLGMVTESAKSQK